LKILYKREIKQKIDMFKGIKTCLTRLFYSVHWRLLDTIHALDLGNGN